MTNKSCNTEVELVLVVDIATAPHESSLVDTLPITKKNKYTVVKEAHNECTYAVYEMRMNSIFKSK